MAFSVDDIYLWVNDLANTTQSGMGFSDTQFNEALKFVNIEIFNKQSGLTEDYQVDNPMPRLNWQLTNTISDNCRLLITNVQITVGSNGYFAYPADYAAFSAMYYRYILNNPSGGTPTYSERWVEMVTDSELIQRLQSSIKPPSVFFPVASWNDLGFRAYPEQVTRINLKYLKYPRTPVRGFTVLANDETEYDAATSVQVEWPDALMPTFAARVAKWVGVNLREEELYAWMDKRVKEGE